VIGWALDRMMEDSLRLTALGMALARRARRAWPGASFRPRLAVRQATITRICFKANGIEISMSRKGNPWDNAVCESFMKTLKYEEVLRNEYRDLADARASIPRVSGKILQPKTAALGSRLTCRRPGFEANQRDAAARQLSV